MPSEFYNPHRGVLIAIQNQNLLWKGLTLRSPRRSTKIENVKGKGGGGLVKKEGVCSKHAPRSRNLRRPQTMSLPEGGMLGSKATREKGRKLDFYPYTEKSH